MPEDLYKRTGEWVALLTEIRFTEFNFQSKCEISVGRLGHAGSKGYKIPTVTFYVLDLLRYHQRTWDVRDEIPPKEVIIEQFKEALRRR